MYNKKTYCPMPFVTLTVNPSNYISRCMMSLYDMGPIEHSTYSNNQFKKLRSNMLNGIWDKKGCDSCYYKEKNNIKSQRQKWLQREKKYLGEEGIYTSNLSLDRNKIYHLYMNFNNICNFKCRMCGPWFSNAWIPDWNKMDIDKKLPGRPKQQVDIDKFLKEYGNDLYDLRQIWITGGEPFMDNSVFDFFDKLKTHSDLSKISVTINTNGSKVPVEQLYKLKEIKHLQLNVSVDATGEIYNYIRAYNYDFEQLKQKIKQIQDLNQENILLTVNGAYQIYNMLNVEEFFDWGNALQDEGSHFIEHRVLTGPKRFQARHAPDYIKEQSRKQIYRLMEKYPKQFYLPDLLTELDKPQDIETVKSFIIWNDKLDDIRKAKELDIVTEIKQYWSDKI